MDQLDKIISHIENEANEEAKMILAEAEKKCSGILEDGKAEAKKEYDSALEAQKAKEERDYAAALSLIEREKRMINLQYKANIIERTVNEALKMIDNMEFKDYESCLVFLAEKYSDKSEKGEIYLSDGDISKLSDGAKEKFNLLGLSVKSGGSDFPKGMVIKYGDVEENCTVGALLHEKREYINDIIAKELL